MVAGDGLVDGVGLCDRGEGENEGEVAKEREGNLSRFGGEHGGGVLGEYEVSVGAGQRAVQGGREGGRRTLCEDRPGGKGRSNVNTRCARRRAERLTTDSSVQDEVKRILRAAGKGGRTKGADAVWLEQDVADRRTRNQGNKPPHTINSLDAHHPRAVSRPALSYSSLFTQ